MRKLMTAFALIFSVAISCDDPGGDEGNGGNSSEDYFGSHFGNVVLVSNYIASGPLNLTAIDPPQDCAIRNGVIDQEGICLTPVAYKGYSSVLTVGDTGNSDPQNGGGARVAGVTPKAEVPGAIFLGGEFDLADRTSFTSWNELWFNYPFKSDWNQVGAELAYQRITVPLNGKFYTMLVPTYSQPFTTTPGFEDCIPENERGDSKFTDANLLDGFTFQRGDYLFCVSDTADECDAEDYQWYDKDSQSLVSTRPSNPRTHSWLVNDPVTCTVDGDRRSFSVNGLPWFSEVPTPFKLYADWSHGIDSVQWKDERGAFGNDPNPDNLADEDFEKPFLLYYYDNGTASEGTLIDIEFDFDVAQSIFLRGVRAGDEGSLTDAQVAAALYTQADFVLEYNADNGIDGYNSTELQSTSASVTVSLSGERTPPSDPEE